MTPTDQTTIDRAVGLLLAHAPVGSRVILFGSHARGEGKAGSDLDFLVVEPRVRARRDEMVRLRDVLRPLRIPVDVLVASEGAFESWAGIPGTLYHDIARQGRIFHGRS